MLKEKQEKKIAIEKTEEKSICNDIKCPFHGNLSIRGRVFRGDVTKKFHKRIVIEFKRTVYIKKYERYLKTKTKLHARLPDCLSHEINVGDYVEIRECRPLSKIISFVVVKKIRSASEKNEEEKDEGRQGKEEEKQGEEKKQKNEENNKMTDKQSSEKNLENKK